MKIGIGKLGKSVSFNSNNWGAVGGDNEAPILFENLIHQNKDHTFVFIGVTDVDRLSSSEQQRINKYNNVINPWSGFSDWKSKNYKSGDNKSDDRQKYMEQVIIPNYKVDKCLFMMGNASTLNVRGKVRKIKDPSELCNPLDMHAKYAGPVIHYLNETKSPWIMVLNDPRLFPGVAKDMFNPPVKVLSQYDETILHKIHTSYTDHTIIENKIPSEYASMETIFLIGKERGRITDDAPNSLDNFFDDAPAESTDKDIKFMIVCNEGRPSRYKDLKRYILDHVEDVDIYGKWNENIISKDSRFKGPKKFNELQSMLPRVKYTFCIPIKKGWCTAKYWEMSHYGIIPFLHPTYDEQHNIKCPDFLRIKDSKDLFDKITYLENDDVAYAKLRIELDSIILDGYYNGNYLNGKVMNELAVL